MAPTPNKSPHLCPLDFVVALAVLCLAEAEAVGASVRVVLLQVELAFLAAAAVVALHVGLAEAFGSLLDTVKNVIVVCIRYKGQASAINTNALPTWLHISSVVPLSPQGHCWQSG